MKKIRQILAWIGIFLLIALYLLTIFFAMCGFENWFQFLMASVIATIMVPVVLWWFTRMIQRKKESEESASNQNPED